MKRRLFMLLLLLVAGATVNVAVASAAKSAMPTSWYQRSQGDANSILESYDQRAPASFPRFSADDGANSHPMRPILCTQRTAWCVKSTAMQHSLGANNSVFYVYYSVGWPLHAFQAEFWENVSAPGSAERFEKGMWPEGERARFDIFYWPLWPGFAINTLFYAAILWMPFGAAAFRRRRRIKRGLCPKCAYDLRNRPSDSSACPECGATAG